RRLLGELGIDGENRLWVRAFDPWDREDRGLLAAAHLQLLTRGRTAERYRQQGLPALPDGDAREAASLPLEARVIAERSGLELDDQDRSVVALRRPPQRDTLFLLAHGRRNTDLGSRDRAVRSGRAGWRRCARRRRRRCATRLRNACGRGTAHCRRG